MFSLEGIYKLKVPAGKLVIIKVSYSDKIERIQILGDFFIHPEESLSHIEDALVGSMINSTKEEFSAQVSKVVDKEKIEMIGVTADAIGEALVMAIK